MNKSDMLYGHRVELMKRYPAFTAANNKKTWQKVVDAFKDKSHINYIDALEACEGHELRNAKAQLHYCINAGWLALRDPEPEPEPEQQLIVADDNRDHWVNVYWDLHQIIRGLPVEGCAFVGATYRTADEAHQNALTKDCVSLKYITTINMGAAPIGPRGIE